MDSLSIYLSLCLSVCMYLSLSMLLRRFKNIVCIVCERIKGVFNYRIIKAIANSFDD